MKVIYLKPIGGYKTELRSDTLWGLLCWGLRHLEGEDRLKAFIQSYLDGTPELIISSAFPYKQVGREKIKFFPKPFHAPENDDDESYEDIRFKYQLRKDLKKLNWISQDDFAKVLTGEMKEADFRKRLKDKIENPEKDPVAENEPPARKVETITHTTIDRIQLSTLSVDAGNGETKGQLYQSDEIHWDDPTNETTNKDTTGLFFLADSDASWLLPVLRLYRHLGLGGNRTTGKGFFEADMKEFSFPEIQDANAYVSLSLYRPSGDDLTALQKNPDSLLFRYLLEERQGKVGFLKGNIPKKAVTYFREGSVFPAVCFAGKNMIGSLVPQETPVSFPVYDNGVGFFVKMKA